MSYPGLPRDILAFIFTWLHGGVILRCSIVCKEWKSATEVDWLWLVKMTDELKNIPYFSKGKNIKINKEIAKKWSEQEKKLLKAIYVDRRRSEYIPIRLRVFPINSYVITVKKPEDKKEIVKKTIKAPRKVVKKIDKK